MGPFESKENCEKWKEEYELPFDVISDEDGKIFKSLSNGWVPYTILVGPDGKVALWESEFQEEGFVPAVEKLYQEPSEKPTEPEPAVRAVPRQTGKAFGADIVILGGIFTSLDEGVTTKETLLKDVSNDEPKDLKAGKMSIGKAEVEEPGEFGKDD